MSGVRYCIWKFGDGRGVLILGVKRKVVIILDVFQFKYLNCELTDICADAFQLT